MGVVILVHASLIWIIWEKFPDAPPHCLMGGIGNNLELKIKNIKLVWRVFVVLVFFYCWH